MQTITLHQPRILTFGSGCLTQAIAHVQSLAPKHLHIITSPSQAHIAAQFGGTIDASIAAEPTVAMFQAALATARAAQADCIVGLGGGSPLDVAKLVAALLTSDQPIEQAFGIGNLQPRATPLICIPTTSGTGSEVSPNAILLDEAAQLKKGVISPHLVPDATFIDPALTLSLPVAVTAYTGLDALTHCVEAFTNRHAHPVVDVYALEGIRLASRFLLRAVTHPTDLEAREAMSLVSLYGGLCLGPVNTAAVHALAYPLGGEFHLAHGLANAILLPHVFRFNAEATPERHAEVATALGLAPSAEAAADYLTSLSQSCGIDGNLAHHGLTPGAIPHLSAQAMTVTRLLRNNPRDLTQADCTALYEQCFA